MIILLILGIFCAFAFGWLMGACAAMGKQADEILERSRRGLTVASTKAGPVRSGPRLERSGEQRRR